MLTAVGVTIFRLVAHISRRALQPVVGALLCSFGTFWAGQGVGVAWPGGELALLWLVALYAATGVVLLAGGSMATSAATWNRRVTSMSSAPPVAS